MNPCPCGYAGDPSGRCTCTTEQVLRYRARISGPLLDRIDLQIEVPRVPIAELRNRSGAEESSAVVRSRVIAARERQLTRAGVANARLGNREVERDCTLDNAEHTLLEHAVEKTRSICACLSPHSARGAHDCRS